MKKFVLTFAILSLVSAILPAKALAGFGVSPAIIKNEVLKPGSHLEKDIYLSRSDPYEDLQITIEPDLQEMSNWITFEPGPSFIFPKGEKQFHLKAIFDVPEDAPYKRFAGAIRILAGSTNEQKETGVSVVKGARLEVNLLTTEIDITDLLIRAIKVVDNVRPTQPLTIGLLVENQGNVPASPECEIEVTTLNGEFLETIESDPIEMIPALQMKEVLARFRPSEPEGEYFANVKVHLGDKILREDRVVFKVLAPLPTPTPVVTNREKVGNMINSIKLPPNVLMPVVAGFALLALIGGLIVAGAKSHKKSRQLIFFLIAGMITLVSLTVAVTVFAISMLNKKKPDQVTEKEKQVMGAAVERPEEQTSVPTSVPTSEPTKAPSLKIEPISPLRVVDTPAEKDDYPVYEKADLNSKVVYTAKESEKLWVMDEIEGWYQVQLPIGVYGWLPQSSVRQAE